MANHTKKRQYRLDALVDEINNDGDDIELYQSLVEESGWSYKDVEKVMSSQSDLVEPVGRLRPLAVLKG